MATASILSSTEQEVWGACVCVFVSVCVFLCVCSGSWGGKMVMCIITQRKCSKITTLTIIKQKIISMRHISVTKPVDIHVKYWSDTSEIVSSICEFVFTTCDCVTVKSRLSFERKRLDCARTTNRHGTRAIRQNQSATEAVIVMSM